ncbi:hypothetical protein [Polyangium sorediatum]|uniref:Uncharacterized protein n=1 Tax=Polyangium sorediatum TaxID=889274 RepID=A0ABT6NZU9_9BACT|nr:hypothetical protein [Polyangium sorediatum]MDI1433867.1 hypothetical protein [Polyangium sorediatum]
MILSPLETLDWFAPRVPPALVSAAAFSRMRQAAAWLPAARGLSFECYLGADSARVDLVACISPAWGCDELAAGAPRGEPGSHMESVWQTIAALCREWADPASVLHERMPCLWLEFDLHPDREGVPPPFATACVQPGYLNGKLVSTSDPGADEVERITWRVLHLLHGGPLSPGVERKVRACIDQLPEGSSVTLVSSNKPRGRDAVRLIVAMPRREVIAYLRRVGFPGSTDEVEEYLLTYADVSSQADIYLDIGEELLPITSCPSPVMRSPDDPRLHQIADRLVDWGLCPPARRDALVAFPTRRNVVFPGTAWPTALIEATSFKLVHRSGQPLEAKGYLELQTAFSLVD